MAKRLRAAGAPQPPSDQGLAQVLRWRCAAQERGVQRAAPECLREKTMGNCVSCVLTLRALRCIWLL